MGRRGERSWAPDGQWRKGIETSQCDIHSIAGLAVDPTIARYKRGTCVRTPLPSLHQPTCAVGCVTLKSMEQDHALHSPIPDLLKANAIEVGGKRRRRRGLGGSRQERRKCYQSQCEARPWLGHPLCHASTVWWAAGGRQCTQRLGSDSASILVAAPGVSAWRHYRTSRLRWEADSRGGSLSVLTWAACPAKFNL